MYVEKGQTKKIENMKDNLVDLKSLDKIKSMEVCNLIKVVCIKNFERCPKHLLESNISKIVYQVDLDQKFEILC